MANPTILLALWCAFIIVLTAYRLLPVQGVSGHRAAQMALQMQQAPQRPLPWYLSLTQVFQPLLRFLPTSYLQKARHDLYWAQMAGQYLDWDEASYWCLRLGLGAAALSLGVLLLESPLLALALAGMAFVAPSVRLGALAKRVRRQLLRELPEMVELLRLEVGAGTSIYQAVTGVSEAISPSGPLDPGRAQEREISDMLATAGVATGIFPRWLRRVLRIATGSNLFAPVSGEEGIFLQEGRRAGLPELVALAVQLDIIARRGVDPGPLLASVAVAVADDYQAQVDRQAEKVAAELIFPTFLFFFVPFMIAVLLPLVPNLLSML